MFTTQSMTVFGGRGFSLPIIRGRLPIGYTELEYIESTGTQYINSRTTLTNASFEITFSNLNSNATSATYVAGVYGYGSTRMYIYFNSNNLKVQMVQDAIFTKTNNIATLKFDNNTGIMSYNNAQIEIGTQEYRTNGYCYLFAAKSPDSTDPYRMERLVSARIHRAKIYNDGTLVRDFIPAKRDNDGIVGMFDTVNNLFYANAHPSGDNFVSGPEVPH